MTPSRNKILKRIGIGFLIFILVLIIAIVSIYFIKRHLGKKEFTKAYETATVETIEDAYSEDSGQTITYNNKKYALNDGLISVVFLGVDKSFDGTKDIGEAGQADAIYILTYDPATKKCRIIPVSRESMVDVQLYSVNNESIGFEKMQLCLSYAYGDGGKTSSENTISSLSKMFYNIPFASYISLDLNSIGPLVDAIGGVDLTVLEDMPAYSYSFKKGNNVHLTGESALRYVQYRDDTKLTSNNDRLARQKQFLTVYLSQFLSTAKKKPTKTVKKLLKVADEYMYSNLSDNKIVYMASEILPDINNINDIEFLTIDGEIKQGEVHAEFYPDEEKLYDTILNVFYQEVK